MSTVTHDLVVKTGSYINREGEEKGRYLNVGKVLEGRDGGEFLLFSRTFNPAGVPNPDDSDVVLVSKFEVKERGGGDKPKPTPAPDNEGKNGGPSDEIPF
jgi:hypothetical protein